MKISKKLSVFIGAALASIAMGFSGDATWSNVMISITTLAITYITGQSVIDAKK